jgi:hypothetical protein
VASAGPADIAKAALAIIEGMKGEPCDEEIADVLRDAVWDAFAAGLAKGKRPAKAGARRGE